MQQQQSSATLIALPVTTEPLPTDYWTTPIYGENTNWYTISNNWLGTGTGTAPGEGTGNGSPLVTSGNPVTPNINLQSRCRRTVNFSHHVDKSASIWRTNKYTILGWRVIPKRAATGTSYYEGTSYQNRFVNPIIMDRIPILH